MWSAPLHDKTFVRNMLAHVEEHAADFKTSDRIKGMLTVALNVSRTRGPERGRETLIGRGRSQECEAPLYFSPSKMASLFHATCPPISTFGSVPLAVSRLNSLQSPVLTIPMPLLQLCAAERRVRDLALARGRRVDQDERAADVCARCHSRVDQGEPGHYEERQGGQSGQGAAREGAEVSLVAPARRSCSALSAIGLAADSQ